MKVLNFFNYLFEHLAFRAAAKFLVAERGAEELHAAAIPVLPGSEPAELCRRRISSGAPDHWFPLNDTQSGSLAHFPPRRDDLSAYEARMGTSRPVIGLPCHLAWNGPGLAGGVFSKLSKLLNQEVALSAPCCGGDFCPPQARLLRGTGMLRTDKIRHFDCHFTFAAPKSSGWRALMLSRWLAADARAEHTGAMPSRTVVARRR